jgi:hypothetical protein
LDLFDNRPGCRTSLFFSVFLTGSVGAVRELFPAYNSYIFRKNGSIPIPVSFPPKKNIAGFLKEPDGYGKPYKNVYLQGG